MAAPFTVPSVPWMPERAWTTCVSQGCVSGLARANYVPFAPQPLPPGMSEAAYELLDPAPVPGYGVPPADDCFPRYVMWVEDVRVPDFAGGMAPIIWTRNLGWDFRNDCIPAVGVCSDPIGWDEGEEGGAPSQLTEGPAGAQFDGGMPIGGSGSYLFEWRIWNNEGAVPSDFASPIWIRNVEDPLITDAELTAEFANHGPWCSGEWTLTMTDALNPLCTAAYTGGWIYGCF